MEEPQALRGVMQVLVAEVRGVLLLRMYQRHLLLPALKQLQQVQVLIRLDLGVRLRHFRQRLQQVQLLAVRRQVVLADKHPVLLGVLAAGVHSTLLVAVAVQVLPLHSMGGLVETRDLALVRQEFAHLKPQGRWE